MKNIKQTTIVLILCASLTNIALAITTQVPDPETPNSQDFEWRVINNTPYPISGKVTATTGHSYSSANLANEGVQNNSSDIEFTDLPSLNITTIGNRSNIDALKDTKYDNSNYVFPGFPEVMYLGGTRGKKFINPIIAGFTGSAYLITADYGDSGYRNHWSVEITYRKTQYKMAYSPFLELFGLDSKYSLRCDIHQNDADIIAKDRTNNPKGVNRKKFVEVVISTADSEKGLEAKELMLDIISPLKNCHNGLTSE